MDSEKLEFKNDLDRLHPPNPPLPKSELIPGTPTRAFAPIDHHTTPSQWSPSAAAYSSPPNLTDNERILSGTSSPSSSRLISDYQSGSEDDNRPRVMSDSPPSNLHTAHEAKVLVPDSDISHSQSQSLPNQMIVDEPCSLTTFSVPETSFDYHQNISQPNDKGCVTAPPGAAGETLTQQTLHPNPIPDHLSPSGLPGQRKRKHSSIESDENSHDPIKCPEQPAESRQPSNLLHDPSIWRKPSFMASPVQRDVETGTQGAF